MKNKVLIGSLITALIAFILYSVNLKKVENSSLKIVGQGQEQVVKNKREKTPSVNQKLRLWSIQITLKLLPTVSKNGQKKLYR